MPSSRQVAASPRAGEDRCPGILAFHEAEDGLLLRIRVPGGRLTADQLEVVGRLAQVGNGLVEITARANVQVRGLSDGSATAATRLLEASGLLPSRTHERVRNILASPLAGRHPLAVASVDEVVDELDRRLCADPLLAALPGRFAFAIDDGSGAVLDQRADVALVALPGRSLAFALAVAGVPTATALAPEHAPTAALDAARAFLELRAQAGEPTWRVSELRGGAAAVIDRLGLRATPDTPLARAATVVPGACRQRDGRWAVTALAPLGRLSRPALAHLGAGGQARLSVWRTVTIVDLPAERVDAVAGGLDEIGLITSPDSGWHGLSACAGLGACAKARMDVRAAAEQRAAVRRPGASAEHWSACERGCGRPPAAVSVVALERGLIVEPVRRKWSAT